MSKKLSQERLIDSVVNRMNIFDNDKESLVIQAITMYNELKRKELLDGSTIRENGIGIFKLSPRRARAKFGKESPDQTKYTVTIKTEISYDLKNDYLKDHDLLPSE